MEEVLQVSVMAIRNCVKRTPNYYNSLSILLEQWPRRRRVVDGAVNHPVAGQPE
jgi:hypothetical protein